MDAQDPVNVDLESDDMETIDVEMTSATIIQEDEKENEEKNENNDAGSQKRKRKLTSEVWKFFEMMPMDDTKEKKCRCKSCGQQYNCASKYGTGNMKRHIKKCVRIHTKDIGQLMFDQANGTFSTRSRNFNQERFRELFINAIVKHDLPLSFVEYDGIRALLSYLQPEIAHISRNTARLDIRKMHADYIAKITKQMKHAPGRICLTSDCWTSIATDGYLSLTAHYIDKNWGLQKKKF